MFELTGKLVFNPEKATKKHLRHKEMFNQQVCLALFDSDICKYYSWFIKKRYNIDLSLPFRGAHLTIIKESVDPVLFYELKEIYNNKTINIKYDVDPRTNGKTWWLKAHSNDAVNIRKTIGLDIKPKFDFHITIGNPYLSSLEHSHYIHNIIIKYGNEYL